MQKKSQKKYSQNNNWKIEVVLGGHSGVLMPKVTERIDLTRIVQLNQTGVFIWDQLKASQSSEELIHKVKTHFYVDSSIESSLESELQVFLNEALSLGAIQSTI